MGMWSNIVGTTSAFLNIGLAGVRLKNVTGNLEVKSNNDSTYAGVTTSKVSITEEVLELNSDAVGSGADWKYSLQRPTSGMNAAVALTLPINDGTASQVLQTDGNGVLSWVSAGSTAQCTSVDTTNLAFGSTSPVTALTLPANAVVSQVDVIIDTPFNGTAPTMSVGIAGTVSKYMGAGDVNLKGTAKDVYSVFPGEDAVGTTENIIITYAADTSSSGSARVLVYYSIPS